MKEDDKRLLSVHLAVLLFGTAGLFGKLLDLSPVIIVYGRVAFASLFLGVYLWISALSGLSKNRAGKSGVPLSKSNVNAHCIFLIITLGIILSLHWITFFHSIQISTVAIGLLSFSTFPVVVVFLEPIFLKSSFKLNYLFFALITLLGVRMLVPEWRWQDAYFRGAAWGCLSGLLFAFLTIINKYLTVRYRAITLAFFQNTIAFLVLLPFAVRLIRQGVSVSEWLIIALLGIVFTAVSHSLFIYGLKTVKARVASIIACMEPVYGIIFAFLILGEMLQARTIAGGLIIIGTTAYLSIVRP